MRKYAASHNEISGGVKLEKEQLSGVKRLEVSTATWLPKIDFFDIRLCR